MASTFSLPNGTRRVEFRFRRRRHAIRLGKCSASSAELVKRHIEIIIAAKRTGDVLPAATTIWLRSLERDTLAKLFAAGLIDRPGTRPQTVGELTAHVLSQYSTAKPNTQRNMRRVAHELVTFFGRDRRIESITAGDANDFRRDLRDRLAETTVTATCKKARTFFARAVDKRWIDDNPLGKLRGWTHTDPSRRHFVDRDTIDTLLRHCELEWQLIVSLARFGGLRCPSELFTLRWQRVDFDAMRLVVYAPKTDSFR